MVAMHTLPRLDGDAQVVLEHPREVLLQLGAAVVGEDLVPVGRLLGLAQVGLELAREHVERGRLADAVGAEPGRGKPEGGSKAGARVGDSGGARAPSPQRSSPTGGGGSSRVRRAATIPGRCAVRGECARARQASELWHQWDATLSRRPRRPSTEPGRGVGRPCSLKAFMPYLARVGVGGEAQGWASGQG